MYHMTGSINSLISFLSNRKIGTIEVTLMSSDIEYNSSDFNPIYYIVIPSLIFWLVFMLFVFKLIVRGKNVKNKFG